MRADERRAGGRLVVTVDAGPAAGAVVALPPGRHLIGRSATCAVRLDDALAELHHAVLDVAGVAVDAVETRATRRPRPLLVGRTAKSLSSTIGRRAVSVVTIGASRFAVAKAGHPARAARPLRPAPRRPVASHAASPTTAADVDWVPSPIEQPATEPSHATALGRRAARRAACRSSVGWRWPSSWATRCTSSSVASGSPQSSGRR